MHCPKCDADVSDSYQAAEPDVGIMSSGYYCDACDLAIDSDDGDRCHDDDVQIFGNASLRVYFSGSCQNCGTALEAGYGLAGVGIGPYMYCPNEHCKKPSFIKSQDHE